MPDLNDQIGAKPITVSRNAGAIDAVQAVARLLVVVLTSIPILLQLVGTRDLVAIIAYLQGQDGVALIAAIGGIGTMAYGVFKTLKRGRQVANVAADSRVPDAVAQIKE